MMLDANDTFFSNVKNMVTDRLGDWTPFFAWLPVTTMGGERVWLKKIYRRWRFKYVDDCLEKYPEYGTLFDTLKEPTIPDSGGVIIPIIRKVMPGILANSIVGVQPMQGMTGSSGHVFSIRTNFTGTFDALEIENTQGKTGSTN